MKRIVSLVTRVAMTAWAICHIANGSAIVIADSDNGVQGITGSRISPDRLRRIIGDYNESLGGRLVYGKN